MLEKNNILKEKQSKVKAIKETFEDFINNPILDELEIGNMIIKNNKIISSSLNLTNDEIREGEYIFIDSNDKEGTFDADTVGGTHASEILSQQDFGDHKDNDHDRSGTISKFDQQKTYFENHDHELTASGTGSSLNGHVHDGNDHPIPPRAEKADTADKLENWQDGEILTMEKSVDIPIGTVLWHYGDVNNIPTGFLLCNGAGLGPYEDSSFPELEEVIDTRYVETNSQGDPINGEALLPNLIHNFIRANKLGNELVRSDGSTIDPNYERDDTMYQDDDIKEHRHTWDGPGGRDGDNPSWQSTRYMHRGKKNTHTGTTPEEENETRPPNIALLPIIKYKNSYHAPGQVL